MDELRTWWEIPAIAHYISVFHKVFHLPDLPVEELETALFTSCTLEGSDSLHQLLAALLNGCFSRKDIAVYNYEPYLSDILIQRWEIEQNKDNPLRNCEFRKLELREKTLILYDLCQYRLDTDDITDKLKTFSGDELRMESIGVDSSGATYWNFDDERLYREPLVAVGKKNKHKKKKKEEKQRKKKKSEPEQEECGSTEWSLVCSTEDEWREFLAELKKSGNRNDKKLRKILTSDFLPLIPGIIDQKAKALKKRLLELAPKRESCRLAKKKDEIAEQKTIMEQLENVEREQEAERKRQLELLRKEEIAREREERIRQREEEKLAKQRAAEERAMRVLMREQKMCLDAGAGSGNSDFEYSSSSGDDEQWLPNEHTNSNYQTTHKPQRKRKSKKREEFGAKEYEKINKILYQLQRGNDAWPFMEPVTKDIAPDYEDVVKTPMDFSVIRSKASKKMYTSRKQFENDLNLIVDNCITYNGQASEFSQMAVRLKEKFSGMLERSFPPPKVATQNDSDSRETVDDDDVNVGQLKSATQQSGHSSQQSYFTGKQRISRVPRFKNNHNLENDHSYTTGSNCLKKTESSSNSLTLLSKTGRSNATNVFGIALGSTLLSRDSSGGHYESESDHSQKNDATPAAVVIPASPIKSPAQTVKRDREENISRWIAKPLSRTSHSSLGIAKHESQTNGSLSNNAISSMSSPVLWTISKDLKSLTGRIGTTQPFQGLVAQLKRSANDCNNTEPPQKKPLL